MERHPAEPVLVEVDSEHRADLGALAGETRAQYLAHTQPDGTIVMVPAGVEAALEARFLDRPDLVEQIEDNRAHPERLVRRPGKDT